MRKFFWIKGVRVYSFNKIDSTNNEAKRRIKQGVKLPSLFIAKSQTAGKGTRGRSFYSDGGGLYMSLALKLDDAHLQRLTILAAVATAQSIERLTGKEVGIKWVNDIYLEGKKLCGILTERVENNVVIGIGVNLFVKEFPEELKNIATSLNENLVTPRALAKEIANRILYLLSSHEDFMEYYKEKSVLLGKKVSYILNGKEYTAIAVNLDKSGALIVKDEYQNSTILTSGDVTLLK